MIARVFALVLLMASALLLGTSASSAGAQDGDYLLTLTEIQPVIPAANDELTVSVEFTNNTPQPLTRVTALLRIGGPVLRNDLDVANVAAGSFLPRLPIVRYSEPAPVPAGGQRTFTMQLPMAELALGSAGAYPMAVEAVDVVEGSVAYTPSVLPWMPTGSWSDSVAVTWLWPLTMPPARAPDGLITDPALASQFGPEGRLTQLLKSGRPFVSQVSWVLDPQTQEMAQILAAPHSVTGPRGPEERPGDASAQQWLNELSDTLASRGADVTAMGYGYPDTTSLVAGGLSGDAVLATATAADRVAAQADRTVRGGFSWAPNGVIDQDTLNVLRGAGVNLVAIGDDAVSASQPGALVTLTTDSGTLTGLRGEAGLQRATDYLSDPSQGAIAGRQLFLAATAVAALNNPGGSMAVVPEATWAPLAAAVEQTLTAATSAPWLRLVPLSELLTTPPPERPDATLLSRGPNVEGGNDTPAVGGVSGGPEATGEQGLAEQQVQGIALAGYVVSVLGQVTTQPSPQLQTFRESLLRSSSTWWQQQPAQGTEQLGQTIAQINEEQGKLAISTAGTITFPGDQGRVPITISNDLDVPAEVGLRLTSEPAYLLRSEDVEDLVVPAGQRVSLEVPVDVVGSQSVAVTAQLFTPQGAAYGPAEEFQLRSTAYSRVAQWVIIGALALLVVLVVRSVSSRIRAARLKDQA